MYSLTRSTQLAVKTIELQTSTEYNKSLSILYDNVKCFKHDFDNIISTIGGFVQTQDISGLEDYYKSLQADCQKTNNIATLNPKLINNPGIYSLLSSKYHKADKLGIKINLDFFVDLNEFEINTYEFSRILGILLDNAIEAANECAEKIVNIKFRNDTKNYRHLVTISNTYQNKDVDTEEIFEKGVSGKAEHTGLGLWEVHQYVNKHPNLNLYTSKTTELFSQQFEIYYTPVSLLLN
ncbi:MAG: GHKL domain-containing protein [Clostridia bacterium]|nr:GHKL domain-containing protein [Clostridia bacterium]